MRPKKISDLRFSPKTLLIWLGGGDAREPGESHEAATYALAGGVVLIGGTLTALVTAAAVTGAHWPAWAVAAVSLLCGVLAGAVSRAIAGGPAGGWRNSLGRTAIAIAVGMVIAEPAALAVFAGTIDRQVDSQAIHDTDATPATALASVNLEQARAERNALDQQVDRARQYRDDALVVARCEYRPRPGCPETRITGVTGAGPETRAANQILAEAQREFAHAVAVRERRAAELDTDLAAAEAALGKARESATARPNRDFGTRWVVMNDYSRAHPGALLLRIVLIAGFALLILLPRIVRSWRGETTQDRHAVARAEIDRAELQAETAVAVKRAEVKMLQAEAETLWAEQQLASTRLAIEAQAEIDRAQQQRRVVEALDGPLAVAAQREFRAAPESAADIYLPIAAEAEAAAKAAFELPAATVRSPGSTDNLPAPLDPGHAGERGKSLIPVIPDITRNAARWLRPLVPPVVARAIDSTIGPVRAARQVFEEVEEITFTLKRTHKVNVASLATEAALEAPVAPDRPGADPRPPAPRPHSALPAIDGAVGPNELLAPQYRDELPESDSPRALPPG
ncbi:MAG TPA: DUF4407 domain-containing protein [Mycobacterium sp.]|nr:DUF4407 domain-containing protein [Mycobacterium sp.]